MPITDHDCPFCSTAVHTDGLIDEKHHIGCDRKLPSEWCVAAWNGEEKPEIQPHVNSTGETDE